MDLPNWNVQEDELSSSSSLSVFCRSFSPLVLLSLFFYFLILPQSFVLYNWIIPVKRPTVTSLLGCVTSMKAQCDNHMRSVVGLAGITDEPLCVVPEYILSSMRLHPVAAVAADRLEFPAIEHGISGYVSVHHISSVVLLNIHFEGRQLHDRRTTLFAMVSLSSLVHHNLETSETNIDDTAIFK
jgi:hypothetical protein